MSASSWDYVFTAVKPAGGAADAFGVAARPEEYHFSGERTFVAGPDGKVWGKDVGAARVTAAPADPEAEGWRLFKDAAED